MADQHILYLDSGPCMGTYVVARAPRVLRAVKSTIDGALDVLDQVDDTAQLFERIFIYRRRDDVVGHLCTRRRGCFAQFHYEHVGELDPDTGEIEALTDRDRAWWNVQRNLALSAWAMGEPFEVREPPALAPAGSAS